MHSLRSACREVRRLPCRPSPQVGRVFFKAIGDKYKAKATKAVAASKSALCSAADADAYGDEFCLV